MPELIKLDVAAGIHWLEAPEADLRILCGCPADAVKHLRRRGLIATRHERGIASETGPNAVLLSDVPLQNGQFANLAEFPVLQMLYRQGMAVPEHPRNTGLKPLLIGSATQVRAQMRYVYRGNYGLISEQELLSAGVSPEAAAQMLRLKSELGFGEIRRTEELVERVVVGREPVEVRHGLHAKRVGLNVFEFSYNGDTAVVDLNLPPHQTYESPYLLGYHRVDREYLSIVHSGGADGWDPDRPAMSSIIMFQGRPYLVDAGPNLSHVLEALGIGVSEIEGVFHTHAHDDHFAGLTVLMRADHRIKYFATPYVRASVAKKLGALVSMDEDEFADLFDCRDLKPRQWNDVGGLQVKPVFSPHPVETNVLFFRTAEDDGCGQYAHLGDIIDLELLKSITSDDTAGSGISSDLYEQVKSDYLTPVQVKKVDAGGRPIHGNAEDFADDASERIVLSHTFGELSPRQKEIGSGAPFGAVDVLVPAQPDYVRMRAHQYITSCFPDVPQHQQQMLLNNPIAVFNPETVILNRGQRSAAVYLVLTGNVEVIRSDTGLHRRLSAGELIADSAALNGDPSAETYRAIGFVQALQIPNEAYSRFVHRNELYPTIRQLQRQREFLGNTWLFGEGVSYPVLTAVARAMEHQELAAEARIPRAGIAALLLVERGELELVIDDSVIDTLTVGNFVGEATVLHGTPGIFAARASTPTTLYRLPAEAIADIPLVRWKLLETYERRMKALLDPHLTESPLLEWRQEYATNIDEIDEQHAELLKMICRFRTQAAVEEPQAPAADAVTFLIEYADTHFSREEELMQQYAFPGLQAHRQKHQRLLEEVIDLRRRADHEDVDLIIDLVGLLEDWIVRHLLTEDQKYVAHRRRLGLL